MKMLVYLFYLCIFSIILGPLGAIPLGIPQINVYFTDIIVGLICLIWITDAKQAIKLIRFDPIAKYFCLFVGIGALSLAFSPIHINLGEKIISGLYLVRLFSYFFVYLTGRFLSDSSKPGERPRVTPGLSLRLLTSMGLILAVIGWVQYFFYPDLRNLYYLGWDPHFKRIFSTFLDPNYFGLMMVLTIILNSFQDFKGIPHQVRDDIVSHWVVKLVIFITLMFTYSRSSFLALFAAMLYISIMVKKIKIIMIIIAILALSIFLLPRPGGVGVQLERVFSIETRIGNWQQAMKIIADHPILGVGFNTIRYAKNEYNFGQDNLSENHAGAGFDNSFLFIAATTGLVGFIAFLLFLKQIFQKGNLSVNTSLMAIIVHSFFLNSLFFPWVMVWMWVVLATGPAAHVSQTPLQNRSTIRGAQGQ